jgi:hypothetical protein
MARSNEFDRDGDPDPKKVVKAGPLGIVPILYISASILMIIAVLIWWASS